MGDFLRYEISHGRSVGIWAEPGYAIEKVLAGAVAAPPKWHERIAPDDACCCRPFHDGCRGTYVCHAAPVEAMESIFRSGMLSTRMHQSGRPLDSVAQEMHANGQKDPADYFEYVCFANGNCVAPDIVTMQRHEGNSFSADQCNDQFYPGVRFFFHFEDIVRHPRVSHDGIQAVKVKDWIDLDAHLVALVMPVVDRKGSCLRLQIPSHFQDRVVYLDHRQNFGLSEWSDAALDAIVK